MDLVFAGFVLGIMGSFHCVGMCGPIALSLPLLGDSTLRKVTGGLLYNIGRTTTYALMGAVFGFVGQGFEMAGFQRWVSIVMGVLMVLAILLPGLLHKMGYAKAWDFSASVRKKMGPLLTRKSHSGVFLLGVLNGLIPCGLVYFAIAGAIGLANTTDAILYMVLFGLGTLPVMLVVSLAGDLLGARMRLRINKTIPYVVVLVGVLFVFRGLGLGIPFLSPPTKKLTPNYHMQAIEKDTNGEAAKGSCCHK